MREIVVSHIDHIQMDVLNLEESISFYRDHFGFSLVEIGMRQLTRWAIVGTESGVFLCMHEYPEGRGQKNAGCEITHFGLVVAEFSTLESRLREAGVRLVYERPVEYHSSRSVYFMDPNGYKIEISEKSGGGLKVGGKAG